MAARIKQKAFCGRKVRAQKGMALHNMEWGNPRKVPQKGRPPRYCRGKGEKVR